MRIRVRACVYLCQREAGEHGGVVHDGRLAEEALAEEALEHLLYRQREVPVPRRIGVVGALEHFEDRPAGGS